MGHLAALAGSYDGRATAGRTVFDNDLENARLFGLSVLLRPDDEGAD